MCSFFYNQLYCLASCIHYRPLMYLANWGFKLYYVSAVSTRTGSIPSPHAFPLLPSNSRQPKPAFCFGSFPFLSFMQREWHTMQWHACFFHLQVIWCCWGSFLLPCARAVPSIQDKLHTLQWVHYRWVTHLLQRHMQLFQNLWVKHYLYVVLWETATLFSTAAAPFCLPTSKGQKFLPTSSTLGFVHS